MMRCRADGSRRIMPASAMTLLLFPRSCQLWGLSASDSSCCFLFFPRPEACTEFSVSLSNGAGLYQDFNVWGRC